jgi:arylsulfatase A-like enzyme
MPITRVEGSFFIYSFSLLLSLLVLMLLPFSVTASSPEPNKPNILIIFTDDVGIDQLDTFGYGGLAATLTGQAQATAGNAAATPNIDAIADAGIRFRNTWAMPTCSVARSVLYTGRYPFRTNVLAAIGPEDLANAMTSPFEVTLPKMLKKAGYTSGIFGKYHVGLQKNNPYKYRMIRSLGWDYFAGWYDETGDPTTIDTSAGGVGSAGKYPLGYVPGSNNGGSDIGACYTKETIKSCKILSAPYEDKNPPGRRCLTSGGIFVPGQVSCTELIPSVTFDTINAHYVSPWGIDNGTAVTRYPLTAPASRKFRNVQATDAAIKWIKRQQASSKPWMATLAYPVVHTPLQPPPIDMLSPTSSDANGLDVTQNALAYYVLANQMIEAMDVDIGRLLVETGLAKRKLDGSIDYQPEATNTLIVYVNDNGSFGSNTRLPFDPQRAKGTVYQTGVWAPLIVAGPMVNQPNRSVDAMINIADVYQLAGEVAGVDVHKAAAPRTVDAQSMLPYLKQPNQSSIRKTNFSQIGLNRMINDTIQAPCQFASSCSHVLLSKEVCEDNLGVWFGPDAQGTYPSSPTQTVLNPPQIPEGGFQHCCQVQNWLVSEGQPAATVIPQNAWAIRNDQGYKLVRNSWKNYQPTNPDATEDGCFDVTTEELYQVDEAIPTPKLDRTGTQLDYSVAGSTNNHMYSTLKMELDNLLASHEDCPGDGNGDGFVDRKDVVGYTRMAKLSKGKSSWYDLDRNGVTDEADLQTIRSNLGKACVQ